jgi:hypothetical protein
MIKTLEAQVDQFLLGWKCPVSHFIPGRTKDFSAPLYVGYSCPVVICCHQIIMYAEYLSVNDFVIFNNNN